jgi:phage terminase small subunit
MTTPFASPLADPDDEPLPDPSINVSVAMAPAQRKAYLGKLAEFEQRMEQLRPKQRAFVMAILEDPTNYTKAARSAGYKFPNVECVKLIRNPTIAAMIAMGEQLREDRTMVTTDRTLHEFAILAFSDITDFRVNAVTGEIEVKEGVPTYATRAISSIDFDMERWLDEDGKLHARVKTRIRLWPKADALKALAVYQKLLSGENGVHLSVDKSRHVHVHQHDHNTWQYGDRKLTF